MSCILLHGELHAIKSLLITEACIGVSVGIEVAAVLRVTQRGKVAVYVGNPRQHPLDSVAVGVGERTGVVHLTVLSSIGIGRTVLVGHLPPIVGRCRAMANYPVEVSLNHRLEMSFSHTGAHSRRAICPIAKPLAHEQVRLALHV